MKLSSIVRGLSALTLLSTVVACDSLAKKESTPEPKKAEAGQSGPDSTQGTKKETEKKAKVSAKEAAEIASALPPAKMVEPIVNPKKLPPYAGKTGSIRGIVHATGDHAPSRPEVLKKMEESCTTSKSLFGKLFREGKERQLADVLVAVTGYEGYVPVKTVNVPVKAEGCAWNTRTVAMTFGQRLTIDGLDNRPYVPEIFGQSTLAQLFVLPTAPNVELVPRRAGRFKLVDSMRLFNVAELFVLAYSTVDVTGADGKFEISGIPVGKVKVNALLPQTGAVALREITIEEGKVAELDFELAFDKLSYAKKAQPTPLDELPGSKK